MSARTRPAPRSVRVYRAKHDKNKKKTCSKEHARVITTILIPNI
ncbi:MAG: hypothetical protein ACTSVX_11565 [Promethearchaeota archaeon]